jgi:hypothetical protein
MIEVLEGDFYWLKVVEVGLLVNVFVFFGPSPPTPLP